MPFTDVTTLFAIAELHIVNGFLILLSSAVEKYNVHLTFSFYSKGILRRLKRVFKRQLEEQQEDTFFLASALKKLG